MHEHIRTIKNIQTYLRENYYHALILNSHHDNINKQLGKDIIPSCKIHMVEEETLGGGSKGGGKEKVGGRE